MNVLSLFSGIGGLDLGLERAGMTIVGQVEIDPWCRTVLSRHFPGTPLHDDVRTAVKWWQSTRRPRVDLVAAGFPCQPVSLAGARLGREDPRWLWPATARVVRALRPSWTLLENVPGLLAREIGTVLGDLAEIGYDAVWDCVPASALGAPHRRDRVFVVAYPHRTGGRGAGGPAIGGQPRRAVSDAHRQPSLRAPVARRQRGAWPPEPALGRVAHGVPHRVDRLRGLGNAVVPAVSEHIGRLILDAARRPR